MNSNDVIRVLIAKVGLDGHDRGAKVIARALQDAGMKVTYTGIRQTPQMVAAAAVQENVDVIGISILSGAHMELFPEIISSLKEKGMQHVALIVGGIIPDEDLKPLKAMGVRAVFGPGASLQSIIDLVQSEAQKQRAAPEEDNG